MAAEGDLGQRAEIPDRVAGAALGEQEGGLGVAEFGGHGEHLGVGVAGGVEHDPGGVAPDGSVVKAAYLRIMTPPRR